jgi:hypothetical protein
VGCQETHVQYSKQDLSADKAKLTIHAAKQDIQTDRTKTSGTFFLKKKNRHASETAKVRYAKTHCQVGVAGHTSRQARQRQEERLHAGKIFIQAGRKYT